MSKQILYVENDAEDVFLIERALERAGIKVDVRIVATAELAIARLTAATPAGSQPGIKLPDIIILDLQLRTSDGLEILKWIRCHRATCALPVIIYSNLEDPNIQIEARALGISAFVPKQADCGAMISALRALLK